MDDFSDDALIKKLQDEIIEDARKHYSEEAIDRWLNPRNFGILESAQGYGKQAGTCGDVMEVWLAVADDRVREARFMTEGCGPTVACGSMATEMATGKTVQEALRITDKAIIQALRGLPREHEHCAALAADTLREALRDYLASSKEPWRKLYKG
ncbi:MAG: iron-sulfur cluster assembly scaffold protein [bacterium]